MCQAGFRPRLPNSWPSPPNRRSGRTRQGLLRQLEQTVSALRESAFAVATKWGAWIWAVLFFSSMTPTISVGAHKAWQGWTTCYHVDIAGCHASTSRSLVSRLLDRLGAFSDKGHDIQAIVGIRAALRIERNAFRQSTHIPAATNASIGPPTLQNRTSLASVSQPPLPERLPDAPTRLAGHRRPSQAITGHHGPSRAMAAHRPGRRSPGFDKTRRQSSTPAFPPPDRVAHVVSLALSAWQCPGKPAPPCFP